MNRPIIKGYRSGRVGHDGNGMVGGSWWGQSHLGYKDICIDDILPPPTEQNSDRLEWAFNWLVEKLNDETFRVEAYFDEGMDESVGQGYGYDLDETFPPEDDVTRMIFVCPYLTVAESRHILDVVIPEISEEGKGYELYDAD